MILHSSIKQIREKLEGLAAEGTGLPLLPLSSIGPRNLPATCKARLGRLPRLGCSLSTQTLGVLPA